MFFRLGEFLMQGLNGVGHWSEHGWTESDELLTWFQQQVRRLAQGTRSILVLRRRLPHSHQSSPECDPGTS